MQQNIGVAQLLERCLERLDQMVRKLADKADGVGYEHLGQFIDAQLARCGVKRVEKTVICRYAGIGQAV